MDEQQREEPPITGVEFEPGPEIREAVMRLERAPEPNGGGVEVTDEWVEEAARDGKGRIICNELNARGAILGGALGDVRFDTFTGCALWRGRELGDAEFIAAQIALQSLLVDGRYPFPKIGPDAAARALLAAARARSSNSAEDWLSGLPAWDGTPRLGAFLADIFGADESPYVIASSRYFWLSMVRRMISPGERADMALVLMGPQGVGKTDALRIIAGERYVRSDFHEIGSADWCLKIRGCIISEFAEFAGHSRSEIETIKAVLTETHDKYRAPYGRTSEAHPRTNVFVASINPDGEGFLTDRTGNRRWLPIKCEGAVRLDSLRENREQYFAEAFSILRSSTAGEFWLIPDAAERQEAQLLIDPWEEIIGPRLMQEDGMWRVLAASLWLLGDVLAIPAERQHAGHGRRLAPIMARFGYARARWRDGGGTFLRGYVLIDSEAYRTSRLKAGGERFIGVDGLAG